MMNSLVRADWGTFTLALLLGVGACGSSDDSGIFSGGGSAFFRDGAGMTGSCGVICS